MPNSGAKWGKKKRQKEMKITRQDQNRVLDRCHENSVDKATKYMMRANSELFVWRDLVHLIHNLRFEDE